MRVSFLGGEHCYIATVEFNVFLSLFSGAERDFFFCCVCCCFSFMFLMRMWEGEKVIKEEKVCG